MNEYDLLQRRLATGWNTWNTRSVLSHVWLPGALALNLGIKEYERGAHLREALIGRKDPRDEQVTPGPRSWDGSYTELRLAWRGVEVEVRSGIDGDDLLLLVSPIVSQKRPALAVLEAGALWNQAGTLTGGERLTLRSESGAELEAWSTAPHVPEPNLAVLTPCLCAVLDRPVGFGTGRPRTVEEITALLDQRRDEQAARIHGFGELADLYSAIQTCMAWDTIYDPQKRRVISPVSRIWNIGWGGFVLFCWDTYFSSYLAALDNRDVAYANVVEMTRERTEAGFVPNFATVNDVKSRDRSQPPVGSAMVRGLYRKFGDRWLLEELFDDLLAWNRWWSARRAHPGADGLLAWGSDPFEPRVGAYFEVRDVDNLQAAAYESGLDNSPMYDSIPYNTDMHLMELADVGLNGLYVLDCEALADIAGVLGRAEAAAELEARAERYRALTATLWDEEAGMFLNRRTDNGELSHRVSPTNFYALTGGAATQAQAERMVREYLLNPEELGGEWMMPSISRSDPAFADQDYWRGRIWGPLSFLAYLGLRRYDLPEARQALVRNSAALLLKEWHEKGHVHENYNALTGGGCDVGSSDAFYHWGGLLGLLAFMERGDLPGPEERL